MSSTLATDSSVRRVLTADASTLLLNFRGSWGEAMAHLRTVMGVALAALTLGVVVEHPATGQLHPPAVPGLRGAAFPAQNPPPDLPSYGDGPDWDGKPPPGVQPLA